MKKYFDSVILSLWLICLPVLIVAFSVLPIAKNERFYERQFEKNKITESTKFSKAELSKIAKQIIDYLYDDEDDLQIIISGEEVFSEQAIIHMVDVKVLFTFGRLATLISIIVFVITSVLMINEKIAFRKKIKKHLFGLLIFFGLLIVSIFLWILIAYLKGNYHNFFNAGFDIFHKIIFPNQQKYQDSQFAYNDNLIRILTIDFFKKISLQIAIRLVVLTILSFLIPLCSFKLADYLKVKKAKNEDQIA